MSEHLPLGSMPGLAEALRSFAAEAGRDSGVRFHYKVDDGILPKAYALLIYHVAREGVKNSLQHARATDVWIKVGEEHDSLVLEIRDNGVGWDPSTPGPEGFHGMELMSDRAQVGGGTLEVRSAPGDGTTVTVRFFIPLLSPG